MLATAPYSIHDRRQLAGTFCAGIAQVAGVAGAVRLHPSEKLEAYAPLIEQYPAVKVLANDSLTLDEAIAAADAVVVHSSGFGSDALINGCPVIVLDAIGQPLGHGADLIRYGGCAGPRTADEFAAAVRALLFDEAAPGRRRRRGEVRPDFLRGLWRTSGREHRRNAAVPSGADPETAEPAGERFFQESFGQVSAELTWKGDPAADIGCRVASTGPPSMQAAGDTIDYSVAIPAYGSGALLADTLRSVLAQRGRPACAGKSSSTTTARIRRWRHLAEFRTQVRFEKNTARHGWPENWNTTLRRCAERGYTCSIPTTWSTRSSRRPCGV